MIKFKEFVTSKNETVEEKLNDFVKENDIDVIDIKYNVIYDKEWDIFMSFALLVYKIYEEDD